MIKKVFYLTIMLLFALYISMLSVRGVITYYIHPRYEVFTYLFALFGAMVAVAGLLKTFENYRQGKHNHDHHDHDHTNESPTGFHVFGLDKSDIGGSLILILILAIGFGLPVKPLSAATASQREIDFNSLNLQESKSGELFFQDTKSLTIGDWVVSLNNNPEPADYIDKEVKVTGFAFRGDSVPEGTFRLSRFVITCCAVDARPLGLLVNLPESGVDENQWYEVIGKFAISEADSNLLVIEASEINTIEQPREPYIY